MPGAGTDKTKAAVTMPGPVIVLVEPQLVNNIGSAARAMMNFGLMRLRLVKPREGWPNDKAKIMASGADALIDGAQLYETLADAIADCTYVLATTARAHDQAKPVVSPEQAPSLIAPWVAAGETVAIVFGRERNGLENDEVGLADAIVTFPINPAFASLNLAQAISLVSYEWFKQATGGALPFSMPEKSAPAPKQQLAAFFENLERELDKVEFFRPAAKRPTMLLNLHNIFTRMALTQQDIQTLHGVVMAIVEGRKGPAKGGVLDGDEAARLRTLLAEHAQGRVPSDRSPMRGLSRFLRRNPTNAERTLWNALTRDRRFASEGFKRQVPIGPHIADLVSFARHIVIDIVAENETADAASERARKIDWLQRRDYRVIDVREAEIERDVAGALDVLALSLGEPSDTT